MFIHYYECFNRDVCFYIFNCCILSNVLVRNDIIKMFNQFNQFIALFRYKLMNHMLPFMFENMFIKTSDVHNYSTRQADMLYVQYASTKTTQRTIKHHGTKLWNSLYNFISTDCAISTQKLKAFLLT